MTKRIIAFLLMLVMLIPCIVSCKEDEVKESETYDADDTVETSETESDDEYLVHDDIGELDLENRTITIANVDRTWYDNEVMVDG